MDLFRSYISFVFKSTINFRLNKIEGTTIRGQKEVADLFPAIMALADNWDTHIILQKKKKKKAAKPSS